MARPDEKPRPNAISTADPPRNFTLTSEERIRALTIGPPAWALRKRHIEDLEAKHVKTLVDLHHVLVAKALARGEPADREGIARAIEEKARALDLRKMNALVDAHNRYYPIEANLPIDPKTGGSLVHGRPWRPEPPWTVERLLERVAEELADSPRDT